MTARPALAPEPVTAAGDLALVQGIERHGPDAPASIVFRAALCRKGQEAQAAGGSQALDALQCDVATADPDRADARAAIVRAAWDDLPPRVGS